MDYRGSYPIFDPAGIRTYPLGRRRNKVAVDGFADPAALAAAAPRPPAGPWFRAGQPGPGPDQSAGLRELAAYTAECARAGRPVVVLSGAHMIKNGQVSLVVDLIERGAVTLFGTNGAGTIHSFELALTGASSEDVRTALPDGDFGMAFETGHYLNYALTLGAREGWGYGECVGRLFCDEPFRRAVIDAVFADYPDTGDYLKPYEGFPHLESCVLAAAYRKGIPLCVFPSLGTDITDQHASFDGAAKGLAGGRDFLVFTEEMSRCPEGGVVLSIGTAIMGPEVLLKAVSMAANAGRKPAGLWTGVFDVRPFTFDDEARDEQQAYYYLRDQKSIATRIPKVFGGVGYYFQGLHEDTLTAFYQYLVRELAP
ncbi:MAG: GSU2086 family protein [Planctomycetota bacterium]|jgi:hypothetical protein